MSDYVPIKSDCVRYSFWKVTIPLLVQIFASGFFITTCFTYSGFQVEELLPHLHTSEVGYYNGILIGAHYLGQTVNGCALGYLTNIFGIYPLLGVSALSGIICPILYGVATNFWCAAFLSFLYGALNGTAPLVNVLIQLSLSDEDSQYAISYTDAIWGVADIIGPMIGGLLSYPGDKLRIFDCAFLHSFPFFLPNIATAFFNAIALGAILWEYYAPGSHGASSASLVGSIHHVSNASSRPTHTLETFMLDKSSEAREGDEEDAFRKDANTAAADGSGTFVSSDGKIETGEWLSLSDFGLFFTYLMNNNTQVVLVLFCFALLSGTAVTIDVLYPLLLMLPRKNGGFSQGTNGVAIILLIQGIFLTLSAIVAPYFTTRYGLRKCFYITTLASIPLLILVPACSALPLYWGLVTSSLLIGLGHQTCIQICFLGAMSMVNFCSSRRYLSHVNGLSVVLASLMSFLAPSGSSAIFAWSASKRNRHPFPFNHHFTFYLYGIISLILAYAAYRLRPEREESCEDKDVHEKLLSETEMRAAKNISSSNNAARSDDSDNDEEQREFEKKAKEYVAPVILTLGQDNFLKPITSGELAESE